MINCNDIYKGCRYIPDRQEKNKEFAGLIYSSDFDTYNSYGTTVSKIVETEKFNKAHRALAQKKYDYVNN